MYADLTSTPKSRVVVYVLVVSPINHKKMTNDFIRFLMLVALSRFSSFMFILCKCSYSYQQIAYHITGPGGGAIQGTASEALLVVLLAARDKVLREVGKDALGRLVVYGSDQTHSSLLKACQVCSSLLNIITPLNVCFL